ncbi:Heptaprenyl diphosphate synthase component I [Caprobacter fermentans]|uniref:Heptaprenyl diphosphate synthase component I n=2 Tax=Caproicibacter fermentans TaxID=2576756 RepID=A0A6N8I170_9FIRM|nr:Gx transporter family protein [Caproicibacter fermentans]MVB11782.1 Heptaprenyl diphosphate synthase component I [Caproicibacter fermentans]
MLNQEKRQTDQKANRWMDSGSIRRMVVTALLFAAAMVMTVVEYQIPIPMPVPGIKLGLSNIVVMYSLFFLKKKDALTLAVLKSMFVFLTRGAVAAFLSFCGGLLSILAMIVCMAVFKEKISYLMISIVGAVMHNLGQIAAVSLLYTNLLLWTYFPVLLISGLIAGAATSTLLRITLPALKRLGLK